LTQEKFDSQQSSVIAWYKYLAMMKEIQGNTSNDISFVACLMAKEYLYRKLPMKPFDVASKPQGAPGLDLDERTQSNQRVIGEIKTTVPYKKDDLGAQQRESFKKDFQKLNSERADYKFFFVTEERTFNIIKKKYAQEIPGVTIVLLITGEDYRI
jgi:hypothetical protein